VSRIQTRAVRLNISLPKGLVQRIDAYAKARHLSRSGFLAKAAAEALERT
jgi:metal-responsive CopG/Arc/MetJ family transcriptional regulator